MWTVAAFLSVDSQSKSVGLVWGLAATLALSLHSSNEPGELSQWLCHDDSTINIDLVIIIIIIMPKMHGYIRFHSLPRLKIKGGVPAGTIVIAARVETSVRSSTLNL